MIFFQHTLRILWYCNRVDDINLESKLVQALWFAAFDVVDQYCFCCMLGVKVGVGGGVNKVFILRRGPSRGYDDVHITGPFVRRIHWLMVDSLHKELVTGNCDVYDTRLNNRLRKR